MNDAGLEVVECGRLPVFRLTWEGGVIDWDFGRSLVGELTDRGLRLLIVRFPSGGGPTAVSSPCCRTVWTATVDRNAMPLLTDLIRHNDLILVDGDCILPLNTLRLSTEADPDFGDGEIAVFRTVDPRQGSRVCADHLLSWLDEIWRAVPVWACVLIGGRSSRMGRPKHLLENSGGRSWLEDIVGALRPHVERVVLAGLGEIPSSLRCLTRIVDVPGVVGPLAGILAAMRWQPEVTWLLVACDMPYLTSPAVQWLLEERRSGRWAVMPHRGDANLVEPLFACYDQRCRTLFEELRLSGYLRIGRIIHNPVVYRPVIPEGFRHAWDNINTPLELELYRDSCNLDREQPEKDDR